MSEKQTKRRRRLQRLAVTSGEAIIAEAFQRFEGDIDAGAKWLAKAMRQVAVNPSVKIEDLLPPPSSAPPDSPRQATPQGP
jgi:hypothetical protein